MNLDFSSLLTTWNIALLSTALLLPPLAGVALGVRGAFWRLIGSALVLFALSGPSLISEKRTPLKTIVAVIVDRSGSQMIGDRKAQTDATLADLKTKLASLDDIDTRIGEIIESGEDGTRLFDALERLLADVPSEQLGAVLMITDGQVHDIPKSAGEAQLSAPLHALITGYTQEADRRVTLVDPPRFGLVGKEQDLKITVEDSVARDPVSLTIRRDGLVIAKPMAIPGTTLTFPVNIEHGGPNVIEVDVESRPNELTLLNNRVVATIDGIRDKLRVLLVSGEPHPGERTWRNMLKSDPNVDLVHFTILRPPQKLDSTPVNELSLIAFPTRDLFEVKIKEFDLIILDRYSDLVMMPPAYFANMVTYVREGGAMLIAAGPEFSGENSVAETALQAILPALPDGMTYEIPFQPKLTLDGAKHPVTRDLHGADIASPTWGEWVRQVSATQKGGLSVLDGVEKKPLLVLSREGKGRVALLLSDQAWLWARDFRGGGPHLDLLRRTGHWLMKEPDLEEEALRGQSSSISLLIERQSMADKIAPVRVTMPSGRIADVILQPISPGLWRARFATEETGLFKLQSGELTSFTAIGEPNPREYRNVISSTDTFADLARTTGGSVRRVAPNINDPVNVPDILPLASGLRYAGANYIGIKRTDAASIDGIRIWPIFTGALGLALLTVGLLLTWLGERGLSTRRA